MSSNCCISRTGTAVFVVSRHGGRLAPHRGLSCRHPGNQAHIDCSATRTALLAVALDLLPGLLPALTVALDLVPGLLPGLAVALDLVPGLLPPLPLVLSGAGLLPALALLALLAFPGLLAMLVVHVPEHRGLAWKVHKLWGSAKLERYENN